MVKHLLTAITCIILLGSCSAIKQLGISTSKPVNTTQKEGTVNTPSKFINDIVVTPSQPAASSENKVEKPTVASRGFSLEKTEQEELSQPSPEFIANPVATENVSALQLKYSLLLNTEVEYLKNEPLLQGIEEWYGTRYRLGGTTKKGIDCSAFVGAIYSAVFGTLLPRTARDQYRFSRRISRTELREGDLLFFNTRGGVSHVGIYLQNNKFVHASVSKGVVISDMFEPYYLHRFVGAGRIENKEPLARSSN
jgi:lipoprotein Spr